MLQPPPVMMWLQTVFTGLPRSVTSSTLQHNVHVPHSRTVGADAGMPSAHEPWPWRNSSFCFSSAFNARSTLRRDNPVASIIAFVVVAPLSTARTTTNVT